MASVTTSQQAGLPEAHISLWPKAELVIALLYLIVGSLWIIFSDRLLDRWTGDPEDTLALQTYKGLNFVITTAALFYLILRRAYHRRRRAEAASREATERFERVARASSDAIFDWDLVTDAVWWSEGLRNVFGYPKDLTHPRMEMWSCHVHPDDLPKLDALLTETVRGTSDFCAGEFRFQRCSGSYADVVMRSQVFRNPAGAAVRMMGGISDITARKQAEQQLERSRRQLRALSARLESLREEERTRIAREIHDVLGQMLTGLKMDLRWIEKRLAQQDGYPAINSILDKIIDASEITDATITNVQKIAAELRPGVLDTLGLASAIQQEANRFQERTGIICQCRLPETPPTVAPRVATAVFRILQETLTNVARHADATQVHVELDGEPGYLVLEVKDNGKGLSEADLADPRSLGLLGMRERATNLGGDVTFEGGATGGTVVTLRIPLAPTESPP